jgi:hypothetical protein
LEKEAKVKYAEISSCAVIAKILKNFGKTLLAVDSEKNLWHSCNQISGNIVKQHLL